MLLCICPPQLPKGKEGNNKSKKEIKQKLKLYMYIVMYKLTISNAEKDALTLGHNSAATAMQVSR